MSDEVFERIVLLIEEKMGEYKRPFERDTCLEKDLGISGDDAYELLITFSKTFNVDLSMFEMNKYFHPEGDSILPCIIRSITGKNDPKQEELTLGDLEKAAISGRLI